MTGQELHTKYRRHRAAMFPGILTITWDNLDGASQAAWDALAKEVRPVDAAMVPKAELTHVANQLAAVTGELGIARAALEEAVETIKQIEKQLGG